MSKKDELIKIFSKKLRFALDRLNLNFEDLQEIRLRVNAPLIIVHDGKEYFLNRQGETVKSITDAYLVQKEDMRETLEYISNYSLYAFEEEIRKGFITIQGGHRIGVAGKTILEGEYIKNIKYISYINVRVAHQKKGCADPVLPYILDKDQVHHSLIISPPRCGKTTLLRDIIRQLSNVGSTVGVVDERSEIGGSYLGIPQNDIGIRTDILDCCPKSEGMMLLLRSMAPQVIAVDEIGAYEDIHAIEYVINCGCKLIATVHGSSIADIKRKPLLDKLIREHMFERYILLDNREKAGVIKNIFDARGTRLYGGEW